LMIRRVRMVMSFSVRVGVRMGVLVGMSLAVVGMSMGVAVRVRGYGSRVENRIGANSFAISNRFGSEDINLGSGEAAPHDFASLEARPDVEGIGGSGKLVKRDARVDEGAEEHVAADAGEAV